MIDIANELSFFAIFMLFFFQMVKDFDPKKLTIKGDAGEPGVYGPQGPPGHRVSI